MVNNIPNEYHFEAEASVFPILADKTLIRKMKTNNNAKPITQKTGGLFYLHANGKRSI